MVHTISSRPRDLGGFSVRRILPSAQKRMVGPFIFFDHMGPAQFAPGKGIDVRPHPHINLATVTYLFEGKIHHRDSLGSNMVIEPGAMNWMTAGRGIVHSERTPAELLKSGYKLDGIQLWVALPTEFEEVEPSFLHYPATTFSEKKFGTVDVKVLLGAFMGITSPVKTHSDLFYVECKIPAGATLALPEDAREFAFYVVSGVVQTTANDKFDAYSMGVYPNMKSEISITAAVDSHLMFLGGTPVGERFIDWNFVSSSKERIEEAKQMWNSFPNTQNSRFKTIPGDDKEHIPLL